MSDTVYEKEWGYDELEPGDIVHDGKNTVWEVLGKWGEKLELHQYCFQGSEKEPSLYGYRYRGIPERSLPPDRRPLVYITGPLETSGTIWANIRKACDVGDMIWRFGGLPFIPHLSVTWATTTPAACGRARVEWMEMCLAMVERCDAVYRIEGESRGADAEMHRAMELGKPVMQTVYEAAELLGYELEVLP